MPITPAPKHRQLSTDLGFAITSFTGRYRFLSNFWPCDVVVCDSVPGDYFCDTVEHAYQLSKTLDTSERDYIFCAPTPGEAKRRGRRATLRPNWDAIKLDVMRELIEQKFSFDLNSVLCEGLRSTGNRPLIEGNTWGDTFWGVCNGIGENHLGKIIMKVRNVLRGV